MDQEVRIRAQKGPQFEFLSTPADIAIYGGSAGGGKSYALLIDPLRYIGIPGFHGLIFRRTTKQICAPKALWQESLELYGQLGGEPRFTDLTWSFPAGAHIRFAHMEHEKNKNDWHGAQLAFIGFDELQQFTENQFWYLLTRARGAPPGIRPYVRATCNPDPDSFVAKLIDWYLDPDTGYAIPERSGVLRYFVRRSDTIHWADTKADLLKRFPDIVKGEGEIKSFTFIRSSVYDNKIMLKGSPDYLGNLKAQSLVDRERLLHGNWKIRACAGNLFRREWFEIVDAAPVSGRIVRWWDRAATEPSTSNPDPDYTATVKILQDTEGIFWIIDARRDRLTPMKVKRWIRSVAEEDGPEVTTYLAQDPGQAGVAEIQDLLRYMAGYTVRSKIESKAKAVRAKPLSAQAEAGNIRILKGKWNAAFLDELENFSEDDSHKHDDWVDCASGAFNQLARFVAPNISFC